MDEELNVKVKYISDVYEENPLSFTGGHNTSAWIDLRAACDVHLEPGQSTLVPLGIAMQLPQGYEAIIAPRSSSFKKYGVLQTNSIGVIDGSYCGDGDEWLWAVYAAKECNIKKGDRVCQFRIQEQMTGDITFNVVASLENPDRGGYGSTGTV